MLSVALLIMLVLLPIMLFSVLLVVLQQLKPVTTLVMRAVVKTWQMGYGHPKNPCVGHSSFLLHGG